MRLPSRGHSVQGVSDTSSSSAIGGHAATIITSAGGEAITLATDGFGEVTSFAGSVYTVATAALGDHSSSVSPSASAR